MIILAIDAGNSRVKWGLYQEGEWRALGAVQNADTVRLAEVWRGYPLPDRIVISNVAGEKIRSELKVLLAHWHREPVWIEARSEECGVVNCYDRPVQLGSDRWAALIGARQLAPDMPCVVVGMGTAMTVDILNRHGEFVGGIIVPGLSAMREALTGRTAGVRVLHGQFRRWPTNTDDGVYTGAVQALAGAVERMYALALEDSQQDTPLLLLNGGDVEILKPLLKMPCRPVENLVLEGLARIAQQETRVG
jgi:type III pantothenate kinase